MKLLKATFLGGLFIAMAPGTYSQTPLTPSPNTPTTPLVNPTPTITPNAPFTNPTPGSTAPYTTPPVNQQPNPPVIPTPAPYPSGKPTLTPIQTLTITPNPAPTPGSPTITQPPGLSPIRKDSLK
jgi:hypothetical protein